MMIDDCKPEKYYSICKRSTHNTNDCWSMKKNIKWCIHCKERDILMLSVEEKVIIIKRYHV